MSGLTSAVGWFTRLPLPARAVRDDLAGALAWLPAIGLLAVPVVRAAAAALRDVALLADLTSPGAPLTAETTRDERTTTQEESPCP